MMIEKLKKIPFWRSHYRKGRSLIEQIHHRVIFVGFRSSTQPTRSAIALIHYRFLQTNLG
ncbi:hypothetical protein [Crocosphaera sp. XPORK-15E]|uniref:hypothetical protein n=1 Tax=Crocosphaera sp. XPORK-15E TaxID=3110247 RepID=UPI002B1EF9C1|nr:hypothetical protein [Crocosphaera sp. XPORK-15E]MEA5536163.1 hypothetical protein [Crocosphaera sp. XPORK-15E]